MWVTWGWLLNLDWMHKGESKSFEYITPVRLLIKAARHRGSRSWGFKMPSMSMLRKCQCTSQGGMRGSFQGGQGRFCIENTRHFVIFQDLQAAMPLWGEKWQDWGSSCNGFRSLIGLWILKPRRTPGIGVRNIQKSSLLPIGSEPKEDPPGRDRLS